MEPGDRQGNGPVPADADEGRRGCGDRGVRGTKPSRQSWTQAERGGGLYRSDGMETPPSSAASGNGRGSSDSGPQHVGLARCRGKQGTAGAGGGSPRRLNVASSGDSSSYAVIAHSSDRTSVCSRYQSSLSSERD